MQFKFCPECGEKLITKTIGDEGETSFCENCGRPWFSFSYPCVICLLTDGAGKYALIRQTYATRNYVCVAGFIKEHETAEQTAPVTPPVNTPSRPLSGRYARKPGWKS